MNTKLITIWGSPGSGKSILALSIAAVIAEQSKNVIIFNGDKLVPALKMYCPNKEIDSKMSVGPLLMSDQYTDKEFAARVITHQYSEYIAFVGMAPSDTYVTYKRFERPSVIHIANRMAQLADYVIIDGANNPVEDTMTHTALEISDFAVRCITADTRGILYLNAVRSIFREERYHFDQHITVLGNVHSVSPISEVMSVSGQYDYTLGYAPEIENKFIAGELLKDFKTSHARDYEKQVRKMTGGFMA